MTSTLQNPRVRNVLDSMHAESQRIDPPLLAKAKGSARFDITDGRRTERWRVTIDKGNLGVSRRNVAADCILRVERSSFERAIAGKLNLMAAVLRGEVGIGGDERLIVLLRRLFLKPVRRRRSQPARKKP